MLIRAGAIATVAPLAVALLLACGGTQPAGQDPVDTDCDGVPDVDDPDDDRDGVLDGVDNCPFGPNPCGGANPDQTDTDGEGRGDACDNCDLVPNAAQADRDFDFVGDPCDNCPDAANDQANIDGDLLGDSCDDDRDGDGVVNVDDDCLSIPDPGQENADGDACGDACDALPADPTSC